MRSYHASEVLCIIILVFGLELTAIRASATSTSSGISSTTLSLPSGRGLRFSTDMVMLVSSSMNTLGCSIARS